MKKIIAILLLCWILLSCVACSGNNADTTATEASTEATGGVTAPDLTSPEGMYGHINQLEPIGGVYKIWSSVGVGNMANHPDGTFELLCNVDMEGATLKPIGSVEKPFTGTIKGCNFTISNFTIAGGEDGAFGFVAVNKGAVRDLLLENVSFQIDPKAQNIGGLAGINEGTIGSCVINSTGMEITEAPEGTNIGSMAGVNSGEMTINTATVDITFKAPGAANVGGIVGLNEGGTLEFNDSFGGLDVTGTNKTVGLYFGTVKNLEAIECVFSGPVNAVDGVLFTNFAGAEENVTYTDCLWRDNVKPALTAGQEELRNKVVQAMYDMGTFQWHVKEDLVHSCTCFLNVCYGAYSDEYMYSGIPYNHKAGSLRRMQYLMNEDGSIKDIAHEMGDFDGFDLYIGSDCCGSASQAWWTVSNSLIGGLTMEHFPHYGIVLPVGNWAWDQDPSGSPDYNSVYFQDDPQVMYESYALLRKGDGINCKTESNSHVRMVSEDAVVVRTQDGKIDPEYSYIRTHENGSGIRDDMLQEYSSWKINYKYPFAELEHDMYIPYTIEELVTGEMEPVECQLQDKCDGYAGMFTGLVTANYRLDCVDLAVTDEQGQEVFNHTLFVSTEKFWDENSCNGTHKAFVDEFYMSNFAMPLTKATFEEGKTYNYTITAGLYTGDDIVIHESSFQLGSAN